MEEVRRFRVIRGREGGRSGFRREAPAAEGARGGEARDEPASAPFPPTRARRGARAPRAYAAVAHGALSTYRRGPSTCTPTRPSAARLSAGVGHASSHPEVYVG